MTQTANTTQTTAALTDLLNDPAYAELFEETTEQKAIRESLFDCSRYEGQDKLSLSQSLNVLGYDRL